VEDDARLHAASHVNFSQLKLYRGSRADLIKWGLLEEGVIDLKPRVNGHVVTDDNSPK
jgi:hypothetical protein